MSIYILVKWSLFQIKDRGETKNIANKQPDYRLNGRLATKPLSAHKKNEYENRIRKLSKSLTLKDFEEIESKLGYALPERLKEFYLQYNGGDSKQQTDRKHK
ncbi:MAG: SMI1/KNR4 family protein [Bacteroides uniformis]